MMYPQDDKAHDTIIPPKGTLDQTPSIAWTCSFHLPYSLNPEDAGRASANLQVAVHSHGTLTPVLKCIHFPH